MCVCVCFTGVGVYGVRACTQQAVQNVVVIPWRDHVLFVKVDVVRYGNEMLKWLACYLLFSCTVIPILVSSLSSSL